MEHCTNRTDFIKYYLLTSATALKLNLKIKLQQFCKQKYSWGMYIFLDFCEFMFLGEK